MYANDVNKFIIRTSGRLNLSQCLSILLFRRDHAHAALRLALLGSTTQILSSNWLE